MVSVATATQEKPLGARDWLRLALDADLSRPGAFLLLALAFYAIRLPLLNIGYGTDTDAWRVAMTGRYLLQHGQYFPSRLPGNPLNDLIMSLLVPGGWALTGLATATVSLLGVYFFSRIITHLHLAGAGLVTIGFAFTPILIINSVAAVDFMWTLTCLLGCYYFALRGNIVLAGVMLGLAIGFRLQSPAFGPAVAVLLWRQGRLRELPSFCLATAGTAAIAFAPVLVVYGRGFLTFYDAAIPYKDVIAILGKDTLGVLGGLGVLSAAVLSLSRLRRLPLDIVGDPFVASWLTVVICYLVAFLRLPHQVGYLLPIFPFGMLLMARYFLRTALVLAVLCIVVSGVIDITTHGTEPGPQSLRHLDVGEGLVLANRKTMLAQKKFAELALADPVPDHSYVMLGYIFPVAAGLEDQRLSLQVYERDYRAVSMLADRGEAVDERHDVHYVWLMPYPAFAALRSQGYNFYVVPDAESGVYDLYGYHPTLFGASFLRLQQPLSSTTKTSKDTGR